MSLRGVSLPPDAPALNLAAVVHCGCRECDLLQCPLRGCQFTGAVIHWEGSDCPGHHWAHYQPPKEPQQPSLNVSCACILGYWYGVHFGTSLRAVPRGNAKL
jgi:hypothetical protein